MRSELDRYPSTIHPGLAGSGWWGAPWGHNLSNVTEHVAGHGCATCCSYLNQCKQCTEALRTAPGDLGNRLSVEFCSYHWHHFQVEEGCQCGRCRAERDQNGCRQAEDADVDPMRRYVAFVEVISKLPPSELCPERVAEIARSMGLRADGPKKVFRMR